MKGIGLSRCPFRFSSTAGLFAPEIKKPSRGEGGVELIPLTRVEFYFFFLAGAFLAAFFVAFFVAFFIEPFLPNVNLQSYRSQCDSYIRFFSIEVKKKMI